MRTNLKVFRILKRQNQEQMAAQIGYERAYYGHIERGFQDGSPAFWEQLQNAFALTDDELQELKKND